MLEWLTASSLRNMMAELRLGLSEEKPQLREFQLFCEHDANTRLFGKKERITEILNSMNRDRLEILRVPTVKVGATGSWVRSFLARGAELAPNLRELTLASCVPFDFKGPDDGASPIFLPTSLTSLSIRGAAGYINVIKKIFNLPAESPLRLSHFELDYFEHVDGAAVVEILRNSHHPLESIKITCPRAGQRRVGLLQESFTRIQLNPQPLLRKLDITSLNWMNYDCTSQLEIENLNSNCALLLPLT